MRRESSGARRPEGANAREGVLTVQGHGVQLLESTSLRKGRAGGKNVRDGKTVAEKRTKTVDESCAPFGTASLAAVRCGVTVKTVQRMSTGRRREVRQACNSSVTSWTSSSKLRLRSGNMLMGELEACSERHIRDRPSREGRVQSLTISAAILFAVPPEVFRRPIHGLWALRASGTGSILDDLVR